MDRIFIAISLILFVCVLVFVAFILCSSPALSKECARPLAAVENESTWQVLYGEAAQEYIEATAGPAGAMAIAMGADAVAYAKQENGVGVALFRNGCAILLRVVPFKEHDRALDKVLGVLT